MEETKLAELNKEMSELLSKYNCTLQVAHTIQVVPNKVVEEFPTTSETTSNESKE